MTLRALAFAWIALLYILFSLAGGGCGGPSSRPPQIVTESEYQDTLDRARQLSEGPIRKHDAREPLDSQEKSDLQEAARLIEGLANFKPTNFATHFLAGKVYQALGDHERAKIKLKECLSTLAPGSQDENIRHMEAEALALLALSLERTGVVEEALAAAEEALKLYPDNPNYLAAKASALIQMGKPEEAHRAVREALARDPRHARALQLDRLLHSQGEEPHS